MASQPLAQAGVAGAVGAPAPAVSVPNEEIVGTATAAAAVSNKEAAGAAPPAPTADNGDTTSSGAESSASSVAGAGGTPSNAATQDKDGYSTTTEKQAPPGDDDEDHEEYHTNDAPAQQPNKATFGDLFVRFATKLELLLNLVGIITAIAAGVAQPLMTIVFGNLTTSFLTFANSLQAGPDAYARASQQLRDAVNQDALFLLYIGIAMGVATYIYQATWVYTGESVTRRIRLAYLRAVLRQDIAYFDQLGAGEVTTRIQSDIQLIQEGISDKIPMSVMFIATFVAGFVVAYIRSPRLAGVLTTIVPCIIVTGAIMNVFMAKFQQTELEHVSRAATIAEESLSTVRTAKAFGIEKRLVRLYDEPNVQATKLGVKKAIGQGFGLGVFFFVIYSAYALAFFYGSLLIARGELASGTVMTCIFSILIGAFGMAMLAPNLQALSFALGAGGKVFETIDRTPPIDSASPDGLKPKQCDGDIELEGVDFTYPARPDIPILRNFNLSIPSGKTTALVGASGSGKSTIVSLVERFYDPDIGCVRLDGNDLRDLNLTWLRSQIGLVSQEPILFSTTIRQNIEYGLINTEYAALDEEKKSAMVTEAAKMANAHGFILQLPEGYDTKVGERGFLLSGGQKQRVCIARAVVSNPKILLLDEATSALDTASESIVQDALDRAAQGRTTITIAHRLSTIKNADQIVVMGKGVILETGTHDRLLQNVDGPYYNLVTAQKIRAKATSDIAKEEEEKHVLQRQLSTASEKAALRESAKAEMPAGLDRTASRKSITSLIIGQKGKDLEAQTNPPSPVHDLFYLLYRLAKINRDHILTLYVPGFVASIAAGCAYPAFSILFGRALQNFSLCPSVRGQPCPEPARGEMLHEGRLNALYFFIVAILSTIAVSVQTHGLMRASTYLMERLRRLSLAAYLRADVAYFDHSDHSSGSLTASLADNAQKINGLVGVTLGTIIQSISTLVCGFIIALIYGPKLAGVCIACVPLTLSAGFVRLKIVVLKDVKVKKAHEGAAQRACEAAASIRTVASLTREVDCVEIYQKELRGPAKIVQNTALFGSILYALSQSFAFWTIALGFWYGSKLLINGELSSGHFFTVLTSVVFGSIQAGNVFSFVPDISNAKTASSDVINLLDMRPEIDAESSEGKEVTECKGHLRLENVHFRYPTRPAVSVLRGLDIEVKPGTYVALVGGSGCGKSTTIQLIERFYDPMVGRVTIDGEELSSLNLRSIRRHIALVSQEPTLYEGSIGFNLRLGAFEDADKVTDEQLRKAAADANILEFIESLPQGFDTNVGGKGTQLSGGQKQRIAIARALIRNPKILLLDEATSALDSESEKVVQEALDKAAKGRTTIAIAHRLSTISRADCIFVLKDGVVAEKGDHNSLMALKGLYAELVNLQELQKAQA